MMSDAHVHTSVKAKKYHHYSYINQFCPLAVYIQCSVHPQTDHVTHRYLLGMELAELRGQGSRCTVELSEHGGES